MHLFPGSSMKNMNLFCIKDPLSYYSMDYSISSIYMYSMDYSISSIYIYSMDYSINLHLLFRESNTQDRQPFDRA